MFYTFLSFLTPVAYAAESQDIYGLLKKINKLIINPLIVLLFMLAVSIFVYGVIQYFLNSAEADEREVGQKHILWGLIGMFIMVAVWGIMTIIVNTLGADGYINSSNIRGGEVHIQ